MTNKKIKKASLAMIILAAISTTTFLNSAEPECDDKYSAAYEDKVRIYDDSFESIVIKPHELMKLTPGEHAKHYFTNKLTINRQSSRRKIARAYKDACEFHYFLELGMHKKYAKNKNLIAITAANRLFAKQFKLLGIRGKKLLNKGRQRALNKLHEMETYVRLSLTRFQEKEAQQAMLEPKIPSPLIKRKIIYTASSQTQPKEIISKPRMRSKSI